MGESRPSKGAQDAIERLVAEGFIRTDEWEDEHWEQAAALIDGRLAQERLAVDRLMDLVLTMQGDFVSGPGLRTAINAICTARGE